MLNRISVEQAAARMIAAVPPPETEEVPLQDARGRTLARDVLAPIDQPPFCRSPLDGYAVRSAEIENASLENPVTLAVTSAVFAGMRACVPVRPGCAARVMTGAMLPEGADCVVMQEHTDCGEARVRIFRAQAKGQNRVPAGEDFRRGSVLLAKGTFLDAVALAVAAAAGLAALPVWRRPRVAILCTGDELAQPGSPLPIGMVYDCNLAYLCARITELGAQAASAAACGDDLETLCGKIRAAAQGAQLVLTTGGVSVGQRDLLPAALERIGAQVAFHGVEMKPGMPTMLSRLGGVPVLSLSGNPFAAMAGFELFARPLLFALGAAQAAQQRKAAALRGGFDKPSPQRRFLRGHYAEGAVTLPAGHSSGQLRSMVGCNCLVDVPAGSGPLSEGNVVEVILL